MLRELILLVWILPMGMAPAAVVTTRVDLRVSELPGYPARHGLDVDADGLLDFVFHTSTTGDGGGGLLDELMLAPQSGQSMTYMGNITLQPGMLLGFNLPVRNAEGHRGLWLEGSRSISARLYSSVSPGDSYHHFGQGSSEAYLGFRLQPNPGTEYYGYIHFQFVDWTDQPRFRPRFAGDPVVVGWALETEPWRDIAVMPIPEPSVGGLLLGAFFMTFACRSGVGRQEWRNTG
jgi:hypothetical protein